MKCRARLLRPDLLVLVCAITSNVGRPLPAPTVSAAPPGCRVCFYGPDNIVFDASGNAYVTDSDHQKNFRVAKLSPRGELVDQWHVFEIVEGHRNGPEGIAFDKEGNLLVTDGGTLKVLRLSPAGKVIGSISSARYPFQELGHIAVDHKTGVIYVAEAGPNRIQRFSSRGEWLGIWHKERGTGINEWAGPQTIAVQKDGTLLIEDWDNRRIVGISRSGQTIISFDGRGDKPGQFANSAGLNVDLKGNIYVPDSGLHRLQKYDNAGRYLSALTLATGPQRFTKGPEGVGIDREGNLYTVDGLSVLKVSATGKFMARWE